VQVVRNNQLQYTLSHAHEPVARVRPGEEFIVETEINVGDAMRTEADRLGPGKIRWPYVNPVTGPIYVETVNVGDVMVVHLHDIAIVPPVYCAIVPGWSAFNPWLGRDDFNYRTKVVRIEEGEIVWNDRLRFRAKPMLGTIGTAPVLQSIASTDNGQHGGNIDVQEVAIGNCLYVPCHFNGGLLYMGDAQAHQGDGELACTSVECRARVRLSVEVRPKPKSMSWPRVEGLDFIMTIVCMHPLEDAFRTAFQELLNWVREDYEAELEDVYMLLGQTVEARATQICNPKPTYVCKLRKSFLEGLRAR
jgi:acetamidase/formamidase